MRALSMGVMASPLLGSTAAHGIEPGDSDQPNKVAAILTQYRSGLHADVIAGKILRG